MDTEHIIAIGVFVWAGLLCWSGRANSPKNRERRARIDALMDQARRENDR